MVTDALTLRDINATIHATDKQISEAYTALHNFAVSHKIGHFDSTQVNKLTPLEMKRYTALIRRFDSLVKSKDDALAASLRLESASLLAEQGIAEGTKVYYRSFDCNCTVTIDKTGHIVLIPYDTKEYIWPITIGPMGVRTLVRISG